MAGSYNPGGPEPPPPTSLTDSSQEKTKTKKKGSKKQGKGPSSKDALKPLENESSWFREQAVWKKMAKRQREHLKQVTAVVEDQPFQLNVPAIYDQETLNAIRASLSALFEFNRGMVKTLYDIIVSRGRTDTFEFNYNKPVSTNYILRKEDAKEIEKHNKNLSKMIKNSRPKVTTVKEYAEDWKKYETLMETNSQFPLFWKVKKADAEATVTIPPATKFRQYVTEKSAKYPDKRPRVFLEVAIKNVGVVGKMVAILYSDYVPMTVKNFLAFCDPNAKLTYKGNKFYLIFQNYYCMTGDVVENRGYGGTSIYGPYFRNEDLTLKHGDRGILTTFQKIPNRNESKFLITFRKLETLNGENVAFGKIMKGLHVLDTIESLGSKKTGRPKVDIYISDCDEI